MSKKSISPTKLNNALRSCDAPVVFDVRKRPAFEQDPDTIPGAIWQIHDGVGIWAKPLPRDHPVVVYCVHGHEVSQNASQALCDIGFRAVFLEGGFDGWKQAGLPVVKGLK
jgi:rhodanese-related sulfurtransferase